MDVLDENEALQQFFEGKARWAPWFLPGAASPLTFTLCSAESTYALPLEDRYQITPELEGQAGEMDDLGVDRQ